MMTNVENIHGGGQRVGDDCTEGGVVIVSGIGQQNAKYWWRAKSFVENGEEMMNISGSRPASGRG